MARIGDFVEDAGTGYCPRGYHGDKTKCRHQENLVPVLKLKGGDGDGVESRTAQQSHVRELSRDGSYCITEERYAMLLRSEIHTQE